MQAGSFKKIQDKFNAYAAKDRICGYTAGALINESSCHFSGGTLSPESNQPVNEETLFEIGSLSKPITGAIIFALHEKKELDIASPVISYLSRAYEVNPIFEHITIRDILFHRAGLPRIPHLFLSKMEGFDDPYAALGSDDLAAYLSSPEELKQPGKFMYSNLGYTLLGEIIKQVTQKSFDEACRENLFDRLGMTRTGTLQRFINDENKAKGYTMSNKPSSYWTGSTLDGPGSILSTNTDLLRFLNHAVKIADAPTQGWQLKKSFFAKILGFKGYYWHNGMTGGFGSYMAFHQDKNAGMFVVASKAALLDHWFYYFSSFAR